MLTSSFPKFPGDPNGHFVFELCSRLKEDFTVLVICPKYKGAEKKVIMNGIHVHRHKQFFTDNIELAYGTAIMTKIKKNPFYLFVLPVFFAYQFLLIVKVGRTENIQAIHAHWLIPAAILALVYKQLFNPKVKVVCTAHGTDVNSFNGSIGKSLKKWILKKADAITAVSNALAKKLSVIGKSSNMFVFPMGIHTSVFSPEAKTDEVKKKWNIHGKYILYVGEIIESKGVVLLIDALPAIFQKYPDMYLVLVGNGNLKEELTEKCRRLNLSGRVIFTGALPNRELPPYFASAELLVLPSYNEGFGLVVAEALSCGTPALTTDLESIHDIIKNNETGFFLTEHSSRGISNRIIELFGQPEKLNSAKEAGRKHIIEHFDWETVGKNYSGLIHNLIED